MAERRGPCGVGRLDPQAVHEVLAVWGPLSQAAVSGRPEPGASAAALVPGG